MPDFTEKSNFEFYGGSSGAAFILGIAAQSLRGIAYEKRRIKCLRLLLLPRRTLREGSL